MNYHDMDSDALYNRCLTAIFKWKGKLVYLHQIKDEVKDYEKKYMRIQNEIELFSELLDRYNKVKRYEVKDQEEAE